jgi:mono/diheme cytochrome c family protein
MKRAIVLISILLFFGMLWAVSAQEATESPLDMTDPALIERGREVFVTLGCTACHGQNAEGTDLAPALAAHSEFAVRRQVRAPIGIMPVYSPAMLPAEDLDAVVAYVLSLVPVEATDDSTDAAHEHEHAALAVGDTVFAHHWLLWLALEEENSDDAVHQIGHIQPYITGAHLAQMDNLTALVTAGDFEAARTLAETMVADVNVFGEDSDFVYLQMIYRAIAAEDAEASDHFITDYLEHMKSHDLMGLLEDLQSALDSDDFEAAAALLEAEFGESLHFEEAGHNDEHSEEEAGHEDEHSDEDEHSEEATEEAHSGH